MQQQGNSTQDSSSSYVDIMDLAGTQRSEESSSSTDIIVVKDQVQRTEPITTPLTSLPIRGKKRDPLDEARLDILKLQKS